MSSRQENNPFEFTGEELTDYLDRFLINGIPFPIPEASGETQTPTCQAISAEQDIFTLKKI